ncbi:MAG TPA: choice-of-anchor tandem repeat GloVer-containing protein [Candidatus Binatia bacterium]|nr:choice-of-anchor tandem repeat GloVer-containing protein [Candidatus Binatia bacterium]
MRSLFRRTAISTSMVLALAVAASSAAQGQTYRVIYNFTGGADGAAPAAGLTMDAAGNFYGTTLGGGAGYGTVFRLRNTNGGWVVTPLYTFQGGNDGGSPEARVIIGPDGSLYGTTSLGGGGCSRAGGCGAVFRLRVPPNARSAGFGGWMETVLYSFTGGRDGGFPASGDLTFDQAGNLYGTTVSGGDENCSNSGCGTVYELTPSGPSWTEAVLHAFTSGNDDGEYPYAGVTVDQSGTLYGTTIYGGSGNQGAVFKLTPSNGGWAESVIYSFTGSSDGASPYAGLIFDQTGNLYGGTVDRGSGNGGTVFELAPSNGVWTFTLLASLSGARGDGVYGSLIMDAAGNVYGTAYGDGRYGAGEVFRLSPSNHGWTYTSLYDFCSGGYPCTDGSYPQGGVIFDADGNLYGTTGTGGTSSNCQGGCGVVFEITPN